MTSWATISRRGTSSWTYSVAREAVGGPPKVYVPVRFRVQSCASNPLLAYLGSEDYDTGVNHEAFSKGKRMSWFPARIGEVAAIGCTHVQNASQTRTILSQVTTMKTLQRSPVRLLPGWLN